VHTKRLGKHVKSISRLSHMLTRHDQRLPRHVNKPQDILTGAKYMIIHHCETFTMSGDTFTISRENKHCLEHINMSLAPINMSKGTDDISLEHVTISWSPVTMP
jgi:hypothetical protein